MKEYSYKGYNFRATNVMTEVHRTIPGKGYRYTALCPLYEIDGLKECSKFPFLTSINECKEYINVYGKEAKR